MNVINKSKRIFCLMLFLLVIFFNEALLYAFEPPVISVENAIKNGEIVFIGRVIKLEEIERHSYQIVVEAYLELINCYYGLDCEKAKYVKMRFFYDTIVDRTLPVELSISSEILIVLNKKQPSDTLTFDSYLEGGVDLAYVIGSNLPNAYNEDNKLIMHSIYFPYTKYIVNMKDIIKWSKKPGRSD